METIKTLKALYKFTHENPNVEIVYISQKLSSYITKLEQEYTDSIIRGIPMTPKHKRDYQLFNDCVVLNGVKFLVR